MIRLFRRFLADPATIGSIAPSSAALAAAMARQIGRGATVFEIGAGTGAITRHIPHGSLSGQLIVFEQDRVLAQHLRQRVGHAKVVEGYFHHAIRGVGKVPENLVILSSVPFKSLSGALHGNTVNAICDLLLASTERRLIQYTYFNQPPFEPPHALLRWRRVARVWANLPPATIWELRAESPARARADARAAA